MPQQTIDIGTVANDGTGDPIRDAFDKCNDNFTELYTGLTGLLDFKGSTDCSANPNYPAASKGDYYLVSVAGKIGGASGIVVNAGDTYFAIADNAGGTQAGVGSSWTVVEGNLGFTPVNKAGDTMTGDLVVPDEAYDATAWNGSLEVPTKNAVRDKIESIGTLSDGDKGDITVSGTGATWTIDNDVVTYAKMQNVSATDKLLGRDTAGSGDVEEIGLGLGLEFSGSGAIRRASGTSFPGSPATDDLFYRTDRRIEYFYDGTRWLSTEQYTQAMGNNERLQGHTTTGAYTKSANPWNGLYSIYVERAVFSYFIAGTGNWTMTITPQGAGSAFGSGAFSTSGAWTAVVTTPTTVFTSAVIIWELSVTENSGTGTLYGDAVFTYRLVG